MHFNIQLHLLLPRLVLAAQRNDVEDVVHTKVGEVAIIREEVYDSIVQHHFKSDTRDPYWRALAAQKLEFLIKVLAT